MSRVPIGWTSALLSDVAAVTMGQSPPGSSYNGEGLGCPFFQGKSEFGALTATVRKWTTAGTKFAAAGDILLSVRAPVGPTNLTPIKCALGRGLAGLHAGPDLDQRFLFWNLRAQEHAIAALGKGSTFEAITGKQVREVRVTFPPLEEQRRIVDLLEDHLSRLDAAERLLASADARLRTLRASQLEELKRNATLAWGMSTLAALAVDACYGTSEKCVPDGLGVAVVRIPNLANGVVDLTDEKRLEDPTVDTSTLMLKAGDLLIVRTNGSRDLIGRTAVVQSGVEAAFASYLIRYSLDAAKVYPAWVRMMFEAPSTRGVLEAMAASSAGQYNLSLTKLDSVLLPSPPMMEQAELLARAVGPMDGSSRLFGLLAAGHRRLETLRASLLAAAFSGHLETHLPMDPELRRV